MALNIRSVTVYDDTGFKGLSILLVSKTNWSRLVPSYNDAQNILCVSTTLIRSEFDPAFVDPAFSLFQPSNCGPSFSGPALWVVFAWSSLLRSIFSARCVC